MELRDTHTYSIVPRDTYAYSIWPCYTHIQNGDTGHTHIQHSAILLLKDGESIDHKAMQFYINSAIRAKSKS